MRLSSHEPAQGTQSTAAPGGVTSGSSAQPPCHSRQNIPSGTPSQHGMLHGINLMPPYAFDMNLLLGQDAVLQNLSTFLSRRDLLNLSCLTKRWHLKILALPELRKKFLQSLEHFVEEVVAREKQEGPTANILAKYLNRAPQEEKLTRAVMALFTQIGKKINPAWQIEIMAEFMRTMPTKMPSVFMLVFQDLCRFRPAVALDFLFFEVAPDNRGARVNSVYGHRTPLMVAAANGSAELLNRMLTIKNVDPDKAITMLHSTRMDGRLRTKNPRYTALAHATESENKPAVLTLLKHGATGTRPGDPKVLSALDYALQSEDNGFVKTVYEHYLSQNRTARGEPLLKYCRDTLAQPQHRLRQTPFIAEQAELAERHMKQLGSLLKEQALFLLHRTEAIPLVDAILTQSWMLTRAHIEQVICAICWLDSPALARRAAHRQVIHDFTNRLPQLDKCCIWIQAAKTGACHILDWLRAQVERTDQTGRLMPLLDHRRGLERMRPIEHAMHARQFDTVALLRQWGGTLVASSPRALDTSLNTAKQAGQEALYHALLTANKDAQFPGMPPLVWSAMLSDTALFEHFMEQAGPPTEQDLRTYFQLAMDNRNFNLFHKLRERAPDIADRHVIAVTRASIEDNRRDQLKAILGIEEDGQQGTSWLSKEQLNQRNRHGKTLVDLYLHTTRFNQLAAQHDVILNAMVAQSGILASGNSVDRGSVEQQLAERGYFRKEVPLFTPPKAAPQKKIEVLSSQAYRQGLHLQPPPPAVIGQDFFSSSEVLGKIGIPTSHT